MSLYDRYLSGEAQHKQEFYDEAKLVDINVKIHSADRSKLEHDLDISDAGAAMIVFPIDEEDTSDIPTGIDGLERRRVLQYGLMALGEEADLVAAGMTVINWLNENGLLGQVMFQLAMNQQERAKHQPRGEADDD